MAIKKRTISTLTTGTDGATTTASKDLGLGAAYAKVIKVEIKGDDANVNATAQFEILDADNRNILPATALDAGTDDSTVQATEQSYSTVGVAVFPTATETQVYDQGGDPAANTEGPGPSLIARSPLTINQTAGTDGDVFRIHVFVEV